MKVLLLGATGNLGSRLVPALIYHRHTVVTYVRSAKKLESLLPKSVYQQVQVIQGDAKNSKSIRQAILDSECDAVVNTAGFAAMAPWGSSDLPEIFKAVLDAVVEAGKEKKRPIRTWFLGGMGVLYYPGTQSPISKYMPTHLEHGKNIALLRAVPPNTVEWSMLCPAAMTPESTDLSVPSKSSRAQLKTNALTPPLFPESWLSRIPLIGKTLFLAMTFGQYTTTLEQNADFIARDLESYESPFVGKTVGVIDKSN